MRLSEQGFSLFELLTVLGVMGIIMAYASYDYRALNNPAGNAASELASFVRAVRSKALATTSAYTIEDETNRRLVTYTSSSCGDMTRTADATLVYELPAGANLQSSGFSICFSPRGLSNTSAELEVRDSRSTKQVQIVLGGGVRIE